MKDYYAILELQHNCSEDEIRNQYRRLAMRWHPDRNPDNPEAEEKFKEIAEAYGVLTDPAKRAEYDARSAGGFRSSSHGRTQENGERFNREDIFRDLFNDPNFQHLFSSLLRDFQRAGYRSNEKFVKESFFANKRAVLRAGTSLVTSFAAPVLKEAARSGLRAGEKRLKGLGNSLKRRLAERFPAMAGILERNADTSSLDITYHTPLSKEEMRRGKTIQVQVQKEDGTGSETLRVRIPPGSVAGQRLRIPGKGHFGGFSRNNRGDLYLCLVEEYL